MLCWACVFAVSSMPKGTSCGKRYLTCNVSVEKNYG